MDVCRVDLDRDPPHRPSWAVTYMVAEIHYRIPLFVSTCPAQNRKECSCPIIFFAIRNSCFRLTSIQQPPHLPLYTLLVDIGVYILPNLSLIFFSQIL